MWIPLSNRHAQVSERGEVPECFQKLLNGRWDETNRELPQQFFSSNFVLNTRDTPAVVQMKDNVVNPQHDPLCSHFISTFNAGIVATLLYAGLHDSATQNRHTRTHALASSVSQSCCESRTMPTFACSADIVCTRSLPMLPSCLTQADLYCQLAVSGDLEMSH